MEEINLQFFLDNYILVGSRQWGGSTKESDWDFVLSQSDWSNISTRIQEITEVVGLSDKYKRNTMHNLTSVKFVIAEGIIVNLIVYDDWDVTKITTLNKVMLALVGSNLEKDICTDKDVRVRVVEAVLEQLFYNNNIQPTY